MAPRTGRRIVALLCLTALLLLSVSQAGHGLPVAILVPFWAVLAILVAATVRVEDHDATVCPAPCLAVLPSRAPPAR